MYALHEKHIIKREENTLHRRRILMNDKREVIKPVADLLTYKIRSAELTPEGGEKVWRIALANPEKVDSIMYILEMDLPEADTVMKVEALI